MKQAFHYYHTGKFIEAEKILKVAIRQNTLKPRHHFKALSSLIYIAASKANLAQADRYCQMAEGLLPKIREPRARDISRAVLNISKGYRFQMSGDFRKALELSEEAMQFATEKHYHRLQLFYCQQTLWHCYALGMYAQGIQRAEKGLDIIDRLGFDDLLMKAWIHIGMAYHYAGLNQNDKAVAAAEKGRQHFQKMHYAWGQTCYYNLRGTICLKSGELSAAEQFITTGLTVAGKNHIGMFEEELNISLAAVWIYRNELKRARQLIHLLEPKVTHSKWHQAGVCYLQTILAMAHGELHHAAQELGVLLDICAANGYEFHSLGDIGKCLPIFAILFNQGIKKDLIRKIIPKAGTDQTKAFIQMVPNFDPMEKKR